ncbi:hypothetical protein ACQCWA_14105 [Rossellomorea aquimaris]|jgi:hypothetical protein|uniref:hypothetical protein n=1 Tax=Rossellomorea aquimaris TaxID=189382 RepID=UPI003CFB207E
MNKDLSLPKQKESGVAFFLFKSLLCKTHSNFFPLETKVLLKLLSSSFCVFLDYGYNEGEEEVKGMLSHQPIETMHIVSKK